MCMFMGFRFYGFTVAVFLSNSSYITLTFLQFFHFILLFVLSFHSFFEERWTYFCASQMSKCSHLFQNYNNHHVSHSAHNTSALTHDFSQHEDRRDLKSNLIKVTQIVIPPTLPTTPLASLWKSVLNCVKYALVVFEVYFVSYI